MNDTTLYKLGTLEGLRDTYRRNNKNEFSFFVFTDKYQDFLKYSSRLDDIDEASAKYFLNFLPEICEGLKKHERQLQFSSAKEILYLLNMGETLAHIRTLDKGEEALLWFCLEHSISYIHNGPATYDTESDFRTVISKLTGISEKSSDFPSSLGTLSLVSLLYGEHCWDLYGCDITEQTKKSEIMQSLLEITKLDVKSVFHNEKSSSLNDKPNLPDVIL